MKIFERPYYPVYLADDVDAVMINIPGSVDGWWKNSDYSIVLSQQYYHGWYKADRRIYDTEPVYGRLIPLFEFSSNALINDEMIVPKTAGSTLISKQLQLQQFTARSIINLFGKWKLK